MATIRIAICGRVMLGLVQLQIHLPFLLKGYIVCAAMAYFVSH